MPPSDPPRAETIPVSLAQDSTKPCLTIDLTCLSDSSPPSSPLLVHLPTVFSQLSHSQPTRTPSPPRFLVSDLKWLTIYLCKPISVVLTTCSSLVMPPTPQPGLPLDPLEILLSRDPWRIRKEVIRCPGRNQAVHCWVQRDGWPAKSFSVCGWLVGLDQRDHWLVYYVDDGTATLECHLPIVQLSTILDTSPSEPSRESSRSAEVHGSSGQARLPSDPRLDPYRRPPSLPRPCVGKVQPHTLNSNIVGATVVSEEVIEKFTSLPIGTTIKLTGQPRELFRGTSRILDVESIFLPESPNEEVEFRNQVNRLRSSTYAQLPFRLDRVWPHPPGHPSCYNAPTHRTLGVSRLPELKTNCRVRLPRVSRLKSHQLTFSLFVQYLGHYIDQRYCQHPEGLERQAKIRVEDLMEESELKCFASRFVAAQLSSIRGEGRSVVGWSSREDGQTKSGSVFLSRGSVRCSAVNDPRKLFSRGIVQLVEQGTLIILPVQDEVECPTNARKHGKKDEGEVFTIPDRFSLGPKLCEILKSNERSKGAVELELILKELGRDELWKHVHQDQVLDILELVATKKVDHNGWTLKPREPPLM